MPKSIKKKECGIMKGGGNGDGIAGLDPTRITPNEIAGYTQVLIDSFTTHQIAAFNVEQKISYTSQKIKFFLEDPTRPITNNDISEYLSSVYKRGGLNTTVNIDKFMANFQPEILTTGDTTTFCSNLFGLQSSMYRKLLTRTEDNPRQCKAAGYGKSVGVKCIWCGEWILDFPECEHALPILMAAGLLGFSTANADEIEKILEYGSSHRLCNQVKNAFALLKWNSARPSWEIDWRNVHVMYNNISTNIGYANNRMRYELYRDGTPNLLSDNIQAATNPGYQSWSMPTVDGRDYDKVNRIQIRLTQCNDLSNRGFHRNRPHIQEACRTIARQIMVRPVGSQYNDGNIQVAGSRKKKSKKKKQKGGVFDPTQIQNLPLQNQLLQNPANLRTYLSQGPDDTTNAWGRNSVANNNAEHYFLARLVAIRNHLNNVNARMGGDMQKIKMYIICKIVLGPDIDMLVNELGGAPPPDPNILYHRLMKQRKDHIKELKRLINQYNNGKSIYKRVIRRRYDPNTIVKINLMYKDLNDYINNDIRAFNVDIDSSIVDGQVPNRPYSLEDCKIIISKEIFNETLPSYESWEILKDKWVENYGRGRIPVFFTRLTQHGGVVSRRNRSTGQVRPKRRSIINSDVFRKKSGTNTNKKHRLIGTTTPYSKRFASLRMSEKKELITRVKTLTRLVRSEQIFRIASLSGESFAKYILSPLLTHYDTGTPSSMAKLILTGHPRPYSLLLRFLLLEDNRDELFTNLPNLIDRLRGYYTTRSTNLSIIRRNELVKHNKIINSKILLTDIIQKNKKSQGRLS